MQHATKEFHAAIKHYNRWTDARTCMQLSLPRYFPTGCMHGKYTQQNWSCNLRSCTENVQRSCSNLALILHLCTENVPFLASLALFLARLYCTCKILYKTFSILQSYSFNCASVSPKFLLMHSCHDITCPTANQ